MREPTRIDLHTHSFLSDGVLLPSELLRRVSVLNHEAVAITDHVDASNMALVIASLQRVLREQPDDFGTRLLVGVELTHVNPASIDRLARQAKTLGAQVVVVHGETPVEPVAPGTNRAAVESAAVDLLAHPGFLTAQEASLAAARGCLVEITTRKGHSLTNGHVARVCSQAGALMVVDTDAHGPDDFATLDFAQRVAAGAGLDHSQVLDATVTNPQAFLARIMAAHSQ
ncbi:MAG: histidinol phosphate phosphatase domain-containing protein [Anaerolineae bacterium]